MVDAFADVSADYVAYIREVFRPAENRGIVVVLMSVAHEHIYRNLPVYFHQRIRQRAVLIGVFPEIKYEDCSGSLDHEAVVVYVDSLDDIHIHCIRLSNYITTDWALMYARGARSITKKHSRLRRKAGAFFSQYYF